MEPSNKHVKLESYDLEAERILTSDFPAMHNNQYENVQQPNYIDSGNRPYMEYPAYMHNMAASHTINQHRNVQQEYNTVVKYENEGNTSHTSGYDQNNGTQFSFVEVSNEASAQAADSDDIPVIVNGKYFKILEEMTATEHQRAQRSIIAICQHCPPGKARPIQGSMRITSNFVRHLKTLHSAKYEEFVIERQNHTRMPRLKRGPKRKSSQLEGQANNGSNSRMDSYTDDDTNVHTPEGVGAYYDDIQPASANNGDSNTDMYSPESNDSQGSDESMEKKTVPGSSHLACDPNEIPTILNGKYFKIIEHDNNRGSTSVVAACQFCEKDKLVKGPLKVTSNFVQHLRSHHFKEYNMYLQEKFNSNTRCRRLLNRQPVQTPFIEKVMNFILASNVPISVVAEPSFNELFRGTGLTMCTSAQLLSRLDEMHADFVENIKRSLQEIPHYCVTADMWISRGKQYFGYCAFWLDNDLRRQMAVLACVRLSDVPNDSEIKALIGQIHRKYDMSEDKITRMVVDGVEDFVQTYHNFSIKSICVNSHNENFNFAWSDSQHILNQFPKHFKRGEDSLHLLTVFDFNNILNSNETMKQVLQRCLYILNKCKDFESDEITGGLYAPTDMRWPSWYNSLTQLIKNKYKIDEICTLLNTTKFTTIQIEYLEEFCMLLKPIADAFEFLQQETYLYFGYFLPTLITIKVKLKKLQDCRRIKHLQTAAQQMSDALLNRLSKYFEMKSECNDAIIAAIVCPAIKMRFLEALHETAPNVNTDSLIQLFIDYAQEYYVDSDKAKKVRKQRPPSVDSFLCFNPDDNEETPSENKPNVIMRKELTNYLHDEDKSLNCLSRYPLVKKVFHKYNTLPPTSVALENFFHTFLNVADGQKGQQLSDEHFERLVLTKANKIL